MSSIAQVLQDGEKIVESLIVPGPSLGKALGALILQVEQLAGHELTNLADDVLGVAVPPEAPAAEGAATEIPAAQAALEERLAKLEEQQASKGA